MKVIIKYILPFLILIISILSIDQWSDIPLGNTTLVWILNFVVIIIVLLYKFKYFKPTNKKDYKLFSIYFLWLGIGIVRGIFVADNYWEWKQLIDGSIILSLPIFVYIFNSPFISSTILKHWLKYGLYIFVFYIIWVIDGAAYYFYLAPVFLLSCFLPILDKKWKIIFIILLLLMMGIDLGSRSQVIKSIASILMSFAYIFSRYLTNKILNITTWFLIILPIFLLSLGITGTFNIFEDFSKITEKILSNNKNFSDKKSGEVSSDTRTFIYVEVIQSAVKNNYILMGRTPARGNDSVYFGDYQAEELKTGKYERHSNELCFPNVFTWLGIIGMLLYCFIYLKSIFLALYKSNNLFLKLIGVYIAFRFLYGWLEDQNRFDINNIMLWMMIAMGYSDQFRKMNNLDFKNWIKSIFN